MMTPFLPPAAEPDTDSPWLECLLVAFIALVALAAFSGCGQDSKSRVCSPSCPHGYVCGCQSEGHECKTAEGKACEGSVPK